MLDEAKIVVRPFAGGGGGGGGRGDESRFSWKIIIYILK